MVTNDAFESADERAKDLRSAIPHAITAYYDRRIQRIVIRLSSGIDIAFSPQDAQGLENAKPSQFADVEISPSGFGIHFPRLDADLYLPALLEGFLGSRKWTAARLGAIGGKSRSAAKTSASRINGTRGGRPAKISAKT